MARRYSYGRRSAIWFPRRGKPLRCQTTWQTWKRWLTPAFNAWARKRTRIFRSGSEEWLPRQNPNYEGAGRPACPAFNWPAPPSTGLPDVDSGRFFKVLLAIPGTKVVGLARVIGFSGGVIFIHFHPAHRVQRIGSRVIGVILQAVALFHIGLLSYVRPGVAPVAVSDRTIGRRRKHGPYLQSRHDLFAQPRCLASFLSRSARLRGAGGVPRRSEAGVRAAEIARRRNDLCLTSAGAWKGPANRRGAPVFRSPRSRAVLPTLGKGRDQIVADAETDALGLEACVPGRSGWARSEPLLGRG